MTELRRHPLIGEWVIICPEKSSNRKSGASDGCGYCSSNEAQTVDEANGFGQGALGKGTFRIIPASPPLFNKDHELEKMPAGICDRMKPVGTHEVLIDSPEHSIALEDLPERKVCEILETLKQRLNDLAEDHRLKYTFIFKVQTALPQGNHPCWQILGTPFIPSPVKQQLKRAKYYYAYKERCLLCDYMKQEISDGERMVVNDNSVVALTPYASRFPYEIWMLPKSHSEDFRKVQAEDLRALARALKSILLAIRQLDGTHGYVIGLHTAPYTRGDEAWKTLALDYHWHIEIKPMVDPINGLSASGGFHLNPIPPEEAAQQLRGLIPSILGER